MYLIVIHIPVYVDGDRYYAESSWQRDLLLARDWLAPAFGGLSLLCPSLPIDCQKSHGQQLTPVGYDDGITVIPSFDYRCRTRSFWSKARKQWLADLRRHLATAQVVHTSMIPDAFRPLGFLAHRAAVKAGVTTVLVGPDMDPHLTVPPGTKGRLVCFIFDLLMRWASRRADLTLLKEGLVHDRYSRHGQNVKAFCHSMHRRDDVISETDLEHRLITLSEDRPLRAVYAGRFVARKGLKDTISAIAEVKRSGVSIEYHLFGSGPEEQALHTHAKNLGIEDSIKFRGFVEYSPEFLAHIAEYDLLLFMPTEEDTPRMLYDAMAAGMPLVGSRIPFLGHRVSKDHIGILVDIGDYIAAAKALVQLDTDRSQLASLARASRSGGYRHSIEEWYGSRAQWTQEAFDRRGVNSVSTA